MSVFSKAGRQGFEPWVGYYSNNHLAGGPIRPLWHLPGLYGLKNSSGGSGIRTHDRFPYTCFQDRRLEPLGHPSVDTVFYHERKN